MTNTPLVKIAHDNRRGFLLISEADFDPEEHTLFGEAPEPDPFEVDLTDETESDEVPTDTEYPFHRGGAYWTLSNGEEFVGKKADAEAAQAEIEE